MIKANAWQRVRCGILVQDFLHLDRRIQTCQNQSMNGQCRIVIRLPYLGNNRAQMFNLASFTSKSARALCLGALSYQGRHNGHLCIDNVAHNENRMNIILYRHQESRNLNHPHTRLWKHRHAKAAKALILWNTVFVIPLLDILPKVAQVGWWVVGHDHVHENAYRTSNTYLTPTSFQLVGNYSWKL